MSQAADYDVANASGASVRTDINAILLAIATKNAGTSAPSTTYANMDWVDTTNSLWKKRNNANSSWGQLGPMDNRLEGRVPINTQSSGYTALAADRETLIRFTTAGVTLGFTAAATLGADWFCYVRNSASTGVLTLDPNSTEQIDGATTITLQPGESCAVICNGTSFETVGRIKDVVGDSGSGGQRGLVPAPASGDAAAGKVLGAGGTWTAPPMPRSYLAGFTLANNGSDATNDIDIAAGACRDAANAADIVGSALTKQLDASFTVGNNQGMRDTGSIANGTWHIYAIRRSDTGVVDYLASLSASAPTMPANYDQKRRIGAILRESGAIVAFSQVGDEFLRSTSIRDVNATNPGTSAVTRTLSVPTGVKVLAKVRVNIFNSGSSGVSSVVISELDRADEAPSGSAAPLGDAGNAATASGNTQYQMNSLTVRTNTSAQVRSRLGYSDASVSLYMATYGWIDSRGRDD